MNFKQLFFGTNERMTSLGLLILRVGIGLIFVKHGYPKLVAGTERWLWLGSQMQLLGISFAPVFWGFMAACAEFFGSIALIVGFGTRIAAFFMAFTMMVAAFLKSTSGAGFDEISHPLSLLVVFVALCYTGSGEYSLDNWLF